MLFATAGKVAVQLANENDQLVWKAYLKNDLVAQCHKEDWDRFEPDFASKEAGQMLAEAYNDIFAAADIEEDGSMIKTDDGDVKNVEPSTAAEPECCGECGKPEGHEPCGDEPVDGDGKIIIIKLNDLLNRAQKAQAAGKPYEHLLAEADAWAKHLNALSKVSLQKEVDDLMAQAESELKSGLDCSATLDTAETLMKLALDGVEVPEAVESVPVVKKSNMLSRFLEKLAVIVSDLG
jgi:hypothetical protein